MTYMSEQLVKIENINAAAKCHKKDCHNENCGVSLFWLKKAAEQISLGLIDPEEIKKYKELEWPL